MQRRQLWFHITRLKEVVLINQHRNKDPKEESEPYEHLEEKCSRETEKQVQISGPWEVTSVARAKLNKQEQSDKIWVGELA